jgi:hypothetical protein
MDDGLLMFAAVKRLHLTGTVMHPGLKNNTFQKVTHI